MLDEVSPEAVHYGFAEMGVHLKSTDVLASLKKNRPERVQSHQYTDADKLFNKVTAGLASTMKFWEALRAVFTLEKIQSVHEAFRIITYSYNIQSE